MTRSKFEREVCAALHRQATARGQITSTMADEIGRELAEEFASVPVPAPQRIEAFVAAMRAAHADRPTLDRSDLQAVARHAAGLLHAGSVS